jgi:hypothetical protein
VFFPIHASILAFGVADDTKRSSALEFGHFEAPIGEPNCKLATRKKPPLRRIPLPHFYEERVFPSKWRQLHSHGLPEEEAGKQNSYSISRRKTYLLDD